MIEIVYIMGSTRSGTTALRNAIDRTSYAGYGEGHIVPLLSAIAAQVRDHKDNGMGAGVEGNALNDLDGTALLTEIFAGYERYLSDRLGSRRLIDKTPTVTPIAAAPDLNAFHSNARFIHCARRHLDNVDSKKRKFPDLAFEQHCREWVTCNSAWLTVREVLGGNFVDFDFHDLATNPERIGARIGEYLGVSTQETAALQSHLASDRPESAPGRDITRFAHLGEIGWSAEEKELFVRICGPLGERMGYGLESYFAAGHPIEVGLAS